MHVNYFRETMQAQQAPIRRKFARRDRIRDRIRIFSIRFSIRFLIVSGVDYLVSQGEYVLSSSI